MDFTKVPRALIYKDRYDIDEFDVENYQSCDYFFYENLLKRPFTKDLDNLADVILRIYNNAYYICTLINMEGHPRQYLSAYKKLALDGHDDEPLWQNYIMPTTMALVYSLLIFYSHSLCIEEKFMKQLWDSFQDYDEKGAPEVRAEFNRQIVMPIKGSYILNKYHFDIFECRSYTDAIQHADALSIAGGFDYLWSEIISINSGEGEEEAIISSFKSIEEKLKKAEQNEDVKYALDRINEIYKDYDFGTDEGMSEMEFKEGGLTAQQAALFGLALATWGDFLFTNKKEEIAPMVNKLFGYGVASIKNKLCAYSQNDRDYVAAIFRDLSPKFADLIKTFDKKH